MAEVHALHPFLDGNTRAMRIFFQQLSHQALWHINPSDTDDSRLLEADIAALEGDYQPLISLLHSAVEPFKNSIRNSNMVKAILFDMDGVLIDSEEYISKAAIEYFHSMGVMVSGEDFIPFIGAGENRLYRWSS